MEKVGDAGFVGEFHLLDLLDAEYWEAQLVHQDQRYQSPILELPLAQLSDARGRSRTPELAAGRIISIFAYKEPFVPIIL
jgi:hypothetical protein